MLQSWPVPVERCAEGLKRRKGLCNSYFDACRCRADLSAGYPANMSQRLQRKERYVPSFLCSSPLKEEDEETMRDEAEDVSARSRVGDVWEANQTMGRGAISPPFMKYFNINENGKLRFKLDPNVHSRVNRPQTILSVGRGLSPVMEWEESYCAG